MQAVTLVRRLVGEDLADEVPVGTRVGDGRRVNVADAPGQRRLEHGHALRVVELDCAQDAAREREDSPRDRFADPLVWGSIPAPGYRRPTGAGAPPQARSAAPAARAPPRTRRARVRSSGR